MAIVMTDVVGMFLLGAEIMHSDAVAVSVEVVVAFRDPRHVDDVFGRIVEVMLGGRDGGEQRVAAHGEACVGPGGIGDHEVGHFGEGFAQGRLGVALGLCIEGRRGEYLR